MDHQKISWGLFPPQHGLTNSHDKSKRKPIDIGRSQASERYGFSRTSFFGIQ